MRSILGILLTAIAGFIGASAGLLAAAIVSFLLLLIFGDQAQPVWDTIFAVIFLVLLTAGGVGGIIFGWYCLLRRPSDVAHALNPKQCLKCGYDLTANETGRCPECGRGIDRKQARYIAKT